jgi:hypothetical protein
MKLPIIPLDKANDFIYGFVIFILSNIVLNDVHSLLVVFIFAIGKEIKDQIIYKGFDYKDLLITLLPGIILTLTNLISYI